MKQHIAHKSTHSLKCIQSIWHLSEVTARNDCCTLEFSQEQAGGLHQKADGRCGWAFGVWKGRLARSQPASAYTAPYHQSRLFPIPSSRSSCS